MKYITLKEFTKEYSQKNKNEECRDVYSITNSAGFIPSNDYFSKDVYSKDLSNYKRVLRRMIAYNPSRINVGSVALQDKDDEVIVSPLYVVFDIDEDIVLAEFLEKFLHSDVALMQIRGLTSGSVRDSLKFSALQKVRIPLINIDKQHVIVENLVKIQTLINEESGYLKKLDLLVKSRFIEMFGDPVPNDKKWNTKTLLDMGTCKNGMNFHYDDSGVELNCLGVGDFKDLSIINNTAYLPTVSLNEMPTEEYLLKDDDIVFVRSNGNKALVGRSVAVYPGEVPTTFSSFCIRYRKKDESILVQYLLRVLKCDSMRKKMAGRGANIQNLNQQLLSALVIPIPPIDLQTQFADFVHQVDKSKLAVEKNLEKLELLKKSLMQQYFG